MISFNSIWQLSVYDVSDRGVPNKERTYIYVRESMVLDEYGLMVATRHPSNDPGTYSYIPHRDHMIWFGELKVSAGDWVCIYSGSGKPQSFPSTTDNSTIHTGFWNKPTTIFADPSTVPLLFQFGNLQPSPEPKNTPQGALNYTK